MTAAKHKDDDKAPAQTAPADAMSAATGEVKHGHADLPADVKPTEDRAGAFSNKPYEAAHPKDQGAVGGGLSSEVLTEQEFKDGAEERRKIAEKADQDAKDEAEKLEKQRLKDAQANDKRQRADAEDKA